MALIPPPPGTVVLSLFKLPDIGNPSFRAGINTTFKLLVGVILLFALLLTVWATCAGFLRTEWLLSPCGPLVCHAAASTVCDCPAGGAHPPHLALSTHFGLLLIQIGRAVGAVGVLCFAAGLIGAIFGFLFGLPHAVDASTAATANAGKTWETSTNLTQISTWLTNAIIGVTLVTAATDWAQFVAIVDTCANWLFEMRHGSPAVIGAGLLGSFVFGFMFCYLYTDLVIARLIATTDKNLNAIMETARPVIASIGANDEVLAPRISRLAQEGETPSVEQATAAVQLLNVALGDLTARRDIKMWARARAVLNDFGDAAVGYMKLLGMPADSVVPTDAGLMIEAARVFYAANRKTDAALWADLALKELDTKPDPQRPVLKQAIVGDAVVLRLAGYTPGGYRAALDLISKYLEDNSKRAPLNLSDDGTGRLYLLRALANGQRYGKEEANLDPTTKAHLVDAVWADLTEVIRIGKYSRAVLREFCVGPTTPPADPHERHDDLAAIYAANARVQSLLADQPP